MVTRSLEAKGIQYINTVMADGFDELHVSFIAY